MKVFWVMVLFFVSTASFAEVTSSPPVLDKPLSGTLANTITVGEDALHAQPAEMILAVDENCRVFGLFVLNDEVTPVTVQGLAKRYVCKAEQGGYDIWNVQGTFASGEDANVPYTLEGNVYTIEAGIPLNTTLTKADHERQGRQVFLYEKYVTLKPYRINMDQLSSYGSGDDEEGLPELVE